MVFPLPKCADVAELADALDSGSSSVTRVKVQVLSSAPKDSKALNQGWPVTASPSFSPTVAVFVVVQLWFLPRRLSEPG